MTFFGDKHVLSDRRAQSRRVVEGGGEIVAEGTPEDVAKEPRSYTGQYLKEVLARSETAEAASAIKFAKKARAKREREIAE